MGDVMREAYKRGWITTRDGNISVMDPERAGGRFYITPSGVRKNKIEVEHIVKYAVENGELQIFEDQEKPSIELDMHWLVHKNRNLRLRSVVHLHPTNCVAAMHKGIELADLVKQFPELGRYTKVGKNVGFHYPGSDELATETAENLGIAHTKNVNDIVGQVGHGVTAVAVHPWAAFEHIERLEHICEIVLKSGV